MKYSYQNAYISVEQIDGFGKNPSLWIGTEKPNQAVKVASFGSEDKAQRFIKWLDYLFGYTDDEVKMDGC